MIGSLRERQQALTALFPTWEPRTLSQMLDHAATKFPQKPLLRVDDVVYTYAQIQSLSCQVATGLLAEGVTPGTHMAVQLDNCMEFVVLTFALARLGAVKIPINPRIGSTELQYVLCHAQVTHYIGQTSLCDKLVASLPQLQGNFALDHGIWAQLQAQDTIATFPTVASDCWSDIIFTSGSTGRPKGVTLTHDMLLRSAFASCLSRGFEPDRRIYVPLPLFHSYGYVEGLLTSLFVGGSILIHQGKFQPDAGLRLMASAEANDILSVPVLMEGLLRSPMLDQVCLDALHAVYCSASFCPGWLWPAIREKFGVDDLITGYGMTEVCGASMQTAPTDDDTRLRTRVGKILPAGCSGLPELDGAQIVYQVRHPETGDLLPQGEAGVLWCKGAVVTQGYYNAPELNATAFSQGWFYTGDMGYFDDQGYLAFTGRCTEMYKTRGENVAPKFVEEMIATHPDVAHAEVVGVPDDALGEAGVAFVELSTHSTTSSGDLLAFCHAHLAPFQVPQHLFLLTHDAWLLTSTGKVSKSKMKEWAMELTKP